MGSSLHFRWAKKICLGRLKLTSQYSSLPTTIISPPTKTKKTTLLAHTTTTHAISPSVHTSPSLNRSCFISYLEIYLESGYDLLDSGHETSKIEDLKKVTMLEDEDGNCHLMNLSMHPVSSEEGEHSAIIFDDAAPRTTPSILCAFLTSS